MRDEALFCVPLVIAMRNFEKMYLQYHYDDCGRNISAMAKRLGQSRPYLYMRLRRCGIELRRKAALTPSRGAC